MSTIRWVPSQPRIPFEGTLALILASLLIVAAGGCDRSPGSKTASESPASSEHPQHTRRRDTSSPETPDLEVERSDTLPERPERIVSLAPNMTEILFALGVGGRVVGVTKFCDYPKEAAERPSVGSFASPDFEKILAQNPDLVLGVISGGPKSIFEKLEQTDLSFAFVRTSTIDQTLAAIRRVGSWVGRSSRAGELVDDMRRSMRRTARRWQNRSDTRPRVLLVYGHDPLVAAGPGTFGHELLLKSGARNALAGADTEFPRLDAEKLLELDPDRILDTSMKGGAANSQFWANYSMVPAVERGAVHPLSDPVVLRPGPRLPEALQTIARAVHAPGAASARDGGVE